MRKQVTPKQLATAIGVSESSIKRWCDQGVLPLVKTAGGHRRLPIDGVMQFLRASNRALVEPSVLGLPAASGPGPRSLSRAAKNLEECLLAGDVEATRRILFDLYLAGHALSEIFDCVVSEAFSRIGDQWECNTAEVYQERRGCEIIRSVLDELREVLPSVDSSKVAIGAATEGDIYSIPTKMAEMILRERGWDAQSIGTSLPIDALVAAAEELRPRIFWVSCAYLSDSVRFLDQYPRLYDQVTKSGGALVVGGRALTEDIRTQIKYSAFCDNMRHLASFADTFSANIQRSSSNV